MHVSLKIPKTGRSSPRPTGAVYTLPIRFALEELTMLLYNYPLHANNNVVSYTRSFAHFTAALYQIIVYALLTFGKTEHVINVTDALFSSAMG